MSLNINYLELFSKQALCVLLNVNYLCYFFLEKKNSYFKIKLM
jgi:hypothetical protein